MSSNFIWKENSGLDWLNAIIMPTKPLVRPFLKRMNFPSALISKLDILKKVYESAVKKRLELLESKKGIKYSPAMDMEITKEFVSKALNDIELFAGSKAARDFKKWAYENFIRDDLSIAFLAWRLVLKEACKGRIYNNTALYPPSSQLKWIPKVKEILNPEKSNELDKKIRQDSPPFEDKEMGMDESPEMIIIYEIIHNEWTREALGYIATSLSKSEITEFVKWAEILATEMNINKEDLLGDNLLIPK